MPEHEVDTRESSLYRKIMAIREKVGRIVPDKKISLKNATLHYVSLRAINEELLPLLTQNGIVLFVSGITASDDGKFIKVCITVIDEQTSYRKDFEYYCMMDESDSRNKAQNFGSTITYGIRYALRSLFMIVDDDDIDSAAGKEIKEDKVEQMKKDAEILADVMFHKRQASGESPSDTRKVYEGILRMWFAYSNGKMDFERIIKHMGEI